MSEQPAHSPEQTPPITVAAEEFSIEALKEDTKRRKAAQAREQQKTSDAVREFYRNFAHAGEPAPEDEAKPAIGVDIGAISIGVHNKQKPRNEDTALHDSVLQLFGVFDGMGGYDNGDVASSAAAFAVHGYYARQDSDPASEEEAVERARTAMGSAQSAVIEAPGVGGTTAVFGKIEYIKDDPYIVWANAGDSRFFFQERPDDQVRPISTDQSQGRYVLNGLYAEPRGVRHMEDEFGILPLQPHNRLLFCSDGITGDTPEQQLDDADLQWAFQAVDPQKAAERLVMVSKKHDDKSAVIVDVYEGVEKPKTDDKYKQRLSNPYLMSWAIISPTVRTVHEERSFRRHISRKFRRAKKALQTAPATIGVAAANGYHKTQAYLQNPEKGKSRRRAIIAGAVGAAALFAAYKFGLFDSIFGSNPKPPHSGMTSPTHGLESPSRGGGVPESMQPSAPSRPPSPPPESLQPPSLRLNQGDTIWGKSAEYLQNHGYPTTDVNVDLVKDAVLRHQGITELDATRLPVGYHFTIPLEVLDELHK